MLFFSDTKSHLLSSIDLIFFALPDNTQPSPSSLTFQTNPQYPEMEARQTSAEKTPLCTVRPLYEEFCEWISAFPDL